MKKLFVGCLAIALLISNMTVVSAQTATDTTQEKTSTFDGIEIVTGETYQPVSEGKNTMKNVAMGDTMEKGNLYRSARVADPYWEEGKFYDGYGTLLYGGNAKKIIDVSEWEGVIDWEKVKASDVDGVILRVGYGNQMMDKQFLRNLKECNRLGIPYGFYLYSYAYDANFAYAEAQGLLEMLKGQDLSNLAYPIFYDIENFGTWSEDGVTYHTPSTIAAYEEIIATFIAHMNEAGYHGKVQVYSGRYYTQTKLNSEKILPYVSWIAEYGPKLNYVNTYYDGEVAWQYTEKGSVDGISYDVDISSFADDAMHVILPSSIQLSASTATLETGLTKKINASVYPTGAYDALSWTSSNPKVAQVSSNGTITAMASGSAIITAKTANGKTASVNVLVKTPTVKLSAISKTMYRGETTKLTATSSNKKPVSWTSSDPTIASVDSNGTIKTLKNGTVKISASANGGKAACTITVKEPIQISATTSSIYRGKTTTLKAIPAYSTTITWMSSNPLIATVSSNGVVTGKKAGTVTITAKAFGKSVAKTIKVVEPSLKVTGSTSLYRGKTTTLKATTSYSTKVTWTSSKPSIATVSSNGVVTGKKAGTVTITAKAFGKSVTKTIKVVEPSLKVTGSTSLYRGKTTTLKATTSYSTKVTWTSSKPSIATVSSNGVVTGKKAGTVTITAKAFGKSVTKTIKVVEPSLKVTGSTSLYRGKTTTLKATTSYSTKVTWKSSNSSIATVSSTGVVTGKKAGTVYIYANAYGKSVKYKLTIKEPALKLNKSSSSIYKGKTTTLKATTSYRTKVTWKSSNSSIATVSSTGVVTGKKAGTAYIYANAYGKSVKCKVTVKNPTITLNKSKATAYAGKSYTLKATTSYRTKISWKSSNTKIATVDSKGMVKLKKAGKVTISATAFGKKVNCVLTVKNPTLKVSKASVSIYRKKSYTVKATAVPGGKVSWSSSNKAIATVSSSGKITGMKKGTAYVYAKIHGLKKTIKVIVK
ncbi:Ig-like domain-containing protein [Longicatena caecimuris]|uniref:Ig-like domain-containing protein n=1 Tax=Longicatena caecimuris TaxID=1796635 RepID=UPI001FB4E79C|nr:Ig-like domain-containing protein [Longicatena caecimuris]MCR1871299.1 Ig-like domain-containing protein [Longicatena caecimuris]MCU0102987.1 Ig-like domain-containing protein [Longicatena caecimuris]